MKISAHACVRVLAVLALSAGLASCGSMAPVPQAAQVKPAYFDDGRFAAGRFEISEAAVVEESAAMRRFVEDTLRRKAKLLGPVKGLVSTLNDTTLFGFRYDPDLTRTAAETFATRSGNCLSIALMTASLAEMIGLEVEFQSVQVPETQITANDAPDLLRVVGHVNLRVSERSSSRIRHWTTIDFLVPENGAAYRVRPVDRSRVVALYFNNKAVDALVDGDHARAYWWVRASLRADPGSSVALNTLGVVWMRLGESVRAQAAFAQAVFLDPTDRSAAANLLADGSVGLDRRRAEPLAPQASNGAPAAFNSALLALIKSGQWNQAQALLDAPGPNSLSQREEEWLRAVVALGQGQQDVAVQRLKLATDKAVDAADQAYLKAKLRKLAPGAAPAVQSPSGVAP